jgi:ATP-dependent DNA helicase RecQ
MPGGAVNRSVISLQFDQEGTAIVVSSIDCFDENQVDAIRSLSSERGIAHVLNSSQKRRLPKLKDISSGLTKLLCCS